MLQCDNSETLVHFSIISLEKFTHSLIQHSLIYSSFTKNAQELRILGAK